MARKYPDAETISPVSVAEIKNEIKDANDFRRIVGYAGDANKRPSRMQRLMKSVRPDAQEINDAGVMNYIASEIKIEINKNRRRTKKAERIYAASEPTFGPLVEKDAERLRFVEKATRPIRELDPEDYTDYQDLTDLWAYNYTFIPSGLFGNYMTAVEMFMDADNALRVKSIINELVSNGFGSIVLANLESGKREFTIEYLYDTFTGPPSYTNRGNVKTPKGFTYFYQDDASNRHSKVVMAWEEVLEKCRNGEYDDVLER